MKVVSRLVKERLWFAKMQSKGTKIYTLAHTCSIYYGTAIGSSVHWACWDLSSHWVVYNSEDQFGEEETDGTV